MDISPAPSIQTVLPPNIPPPPKPKNNLIFIIVGFVILFAVLFGGYYLTKSSITEKPISKLQVKNPQITSVQSSPTPDLYTESSRSATANWKTYINTIDKFSFKYPMNWKVTTEGGSDPEKSDMIAINDNCNYETGEVCVNIDISYIPAPDYKEGQNISDYFDTYIKKIDRKNSQKMRVDNVDALLTLSSIQNYGESWENPFYILEIIQNKKALWMTYSEQAKKKQPDLKYKQTFDQILSTFKFTDQVSNNSVSQECGVCGPEGIHNVNGAVCATGLVCKKGITTSLSYCVKQGSSTEICETSQ